jgi:hypothetical protein
MESAINIDKSRLMRDGEHDGNGRASCHDARRGGAQKPATISADLFGGVTRVHRLSPRSGRSFSAALAACIRRPTATGGF